MAEFSVRYNGWRCFSKYTRCVSWLQVTGIDRFFSWLQGNPARITERRPPASSLSIREADIERCDYVCGGMYDSSGAVSAKYQLKLGLSSPQKEVHIASTPWSVNGLYGLEDIA
jgi:hypothetical protein